MLMVEQALIEPLKDPTGQVFIARASAYPLCYRKEGWDGPTLAGMLEEYYDQVKRIGQDWVRLGLWSRSPTLGKLQTGQVIPIKEIVTFLYLRPRAALVDTSVDTLDVFRIISGRQEEYLWDNMEHAFRGIVGGKFDYNTEDEKQSGIPIYAIMWDENQNSSEGTGPSRHVMQLGNNPWSSIPDDLRQRIEAGLLDFSIQCDYKTSEGLGVRGVTFHKELIDLYIACDSLPILPDPLSDEADLLLTSSVGDILDILYTKGATAFY